MSQRGGGMLLPLQHVPPAAVRPAARAGPPRVMKLVSSLLLVCLGLLAAAQGLAAALLWADAEACQQPLAAAAAGTATLASALLASIAVDVRQAGSRLAYHSDASAVLVLAYAALSVRQWFWARAAPASTACPALLRSLGLAALPAQIGGVALTWVVGFVAGSASGHRA